MRMTQIPSVAALAVMDSGRAARRGPDRIGQQDREGSRNRERPGLMSAVNSENP
jgi:hypothetical protein